MRRFGFILLLAILLPALGEAQTDWPDNVKAQSILIKDAGDLYSEAVEINKDWYNGLLSTSSSIGLLTDVSLTSASQGEILMRQGGSWVDVAPTTDHLAEGSNLFYTDERVDDRAAALIQDGTLIEWVYDDTAGTLTGNFTGDVTEDDLTDDSIGTLSDVTLTSPSQGDVLYRSGGVWGDAALASVETDPVFGASDIAGVTSTDISNWDSAYSASHAAVTVSGTPDYVTLVGQDLVRGTVDISDDTNLSADGTEIVLTGDALSLGSSVARDSELPVGANPTATATGSAINGVATTYMRSDAAPAIQSAAADGSTKGVASFAAADFDASSGNISIDYTNGQAASGSAKGFLTSANWTTFNSKQAGDADLTALAALSTTGMMARTAANTYTMRTITGTANQVSVSNGDGVSGNPTLSLPTTVNVTAKVTADSVGLKPGLTYTVASSTSVGNDAADYQCDATADDVQIQAAIDAASSAGGGTVQLLEGTYNIAASSSVNMKSNVSLVGVGSNATIIAVAGTATTMGVMFNSASASVSNCRIANIGFTKSGINYGEINFTGASNTISNITIENCAFTVTTAASAIATITAGGTISNVMLLNNTVSLSTSAQYGFIFTIPVQHLAIRGNRFTQTNTGGYNCIAVYGDSLYFDVSDNIVDGVGHSAIAVSNAANGVVANNVVSAPANANEYGIEVEHKTGHSPSNNKVENVIVTGNLVYKASGTGTGGIIVRQDTGTIDPDAVLVYGNHIEDCTTGINVTYGDNISVWGNTFDNVTTPYAQSAGVTTAPFYAQTGVEIGEDQASVFEGATNDGYETTLTVADPTADRTITMPDATGTVAVSASTPISLSSGGAISIADAAADGSTKGAATFAAADFNASSGVISLDSGSTTFDSNYVNASGDIMTGNLTFANPSASATDAASWYWTHLASGSFQLIDGTDAAPLFSFTSTAADTNNHYITGTSHIFGKGAADVDYIFSADGESNDGSFTWMEDENAWRFDDAFYCPTIYGVTVGGTNRDLYVDNNGVIGYVTSARVLNGKLNKTNERDVKTSDTAPLLQLKPKRYDRTDGSRNGEIGLIAEEVEQVMPEIVSYHQDLRWETHEKDDGTTESVPIITTTDQPETVNYSQLIVPLLAKVQEQEKRIDALETRISALESRGGGRVASAALGFGLVALVGGAEWIRRRREAA